MEVASRKDGRMAIRPVCACFPPPLPNTPLTVYRSPFTVLLQPFIRSMHQIAHNTTGQEAMVLMASRLSSNRFKVINEKAQPVGEIRQPTTDELVGYGRETVYLERPMPPLHSRSL